MIHIKATQTVGLNTGDKEIANVEQRGVGRECIHLIVQAHLDLVSNIRPGIDHLSISLPDVVCRSTDVTLQLQTGANCR